MAMLPPTLHGQARQYLAIRDRLDKLKIEVKNARLQLDVAEEELLDTMGEEGAASVDVIETNGERVKLSLTNRIFARRAKDASAHDMHALLRRLGFSEIIHESVNASTLAAVVREITEELGVRHGTSDEITKALAVELGAEFSELVTVQSKYALSVRRP